ncbi:MAG: Wzz/FepE/Etk N-terminal domain-containing protein [Candidatus Eisenbacteria bacterium]
MSAPEGIDLRGMVRAVARQWRLVLGTAFGAAVLTLAITFVLPKWYRATAVILPPEESDLLSNMSLAQRALSKFPAFGILQDYFTPADVFKAILNSRSIQEELVRRFDLQRVYKQKSLEKTLKALSDNTRIKLNPDGTLKVSVDDRDPARAAAIANGYLEALDRFNVEKRNTTAHRTRVFLQTRLAETDSLLRASEGALRQYQERHRTVAPPTAGSADVQAAADIMSRKLMLQVRLGVLRSYLSDETDQVTQVRQELAQLEQRLSSIPELQGDLLRLIRDTKVYEQLYLLLTAELEQARIRETMNTPTVQLLDRAMPPERHTRPKKGLLTVAAFLLAMIGSAVWVAAQDRSARPQPE